MNTSPLFGKNILLGITGSIAAYKTPELTRQLVKLGANVKIIATKDACNFVTPLTKTATSSPKIDEILELKFDSLTEFSKLLSSQSNFILSIFNFNTSTEIHGDMVVTKILDYPFSHGVWIGEPCNGIKIFGLFTIFIISFKGKWSKKIWFIPLGILCLHFLKI